MISADRKLKTALAVTKVTAACFGMLAVWMAWRTIQTKGVVAGLFALYFAALAWGCWRQRSAAMKFTVATLFFIAFVVVFGAINPFAASEHPNRVWTDWDIALYIAKFLALGALAIFSSACIDYVRAQDDRPPPPTTEEKRIMVLLVCGLLSIACLIFAIFLPHMIR